MNFIALFQGIKLNAHNQFFFYKVNMYCKQLTYCILLCFFLIDTGAQLAAVKWKKRGRINTCTVYRG